MEELENIKSFCKSLEKRDKEKSLTLFLKLNENTKIVFLKKCKEIINHEKEYDENTYKIAYKICKLFKKYEHKETDSSELGKLYDNLKNWNDENVDGRESPNLAKGKIKIKLEGVGDDVAERLEQKKRRRKKSDKDDNENEDGEKKEKKRKKIAIDTRVSAKRTKKAKKMYEKKYQKYDEPTSDLDPLLLYYKSLYKEKSDSKVAVKWLTEHGVYDGSKRDKLLEKYERLKK